MGEEETLRILQSVARKGDILCVRMHHKGGELDIRSGVLLGGKCFDI